MVKSNSDMIPNRESVAPQLGDMNLWNIYSQW